MKLKSMEIPEDEQGEYGEGSLAIEQPKYPFGLKISLDAKALAMLGVEKLPSVGVEFELEAVAVVERVSDDLSYPECRCIGLQIVALGMKKAEKKKSAAEAVYGE